MKTLRVQKNTDAPLAPSMLSGVFARKKGLWLEVPDFHESGESTCPTPFADVSSANTSSGFCALADSFMLVKFHTVFGSSKNLQKHRHLAPEFPPNALNRTYMEKVLAGGGLHRHCTELFLGQSRLPRSNIVVMVLGSVRV